MSSVKESLRHAIQLLSEDEALQTLEFIQILHQKKELSRTLKRLASDPAFHIPAEDLGGFHKVEAFTGKGIPASKRLVEDRR